MKYTARSCKYIFKNFWFILPFAVLPAVFLALSTDGEAINCVIQTLFSGELTEMHFVHIFRAISVLSFASWQPVVFGLIALVMLIVCAAMMMALLEKHLRIGKRTYNGLFSKLNDNLISTAGYGLLLFAVYELWALITATFLWLASRIPFAPVAYTLIIFLFLAMQVLLIYAVGIIYLWLPCMQITGFRALEAFQYSYQLTTPFKWKLLVIQLVFLLTVEAITCVCALFIPDTVWFIVATTVMYALLIMIYCVRMEIAYFDRDNIERADVKKKYFTR